MLRIFHTADWHYSLNRDDQVRPAINFLVKEVIEKKPDVVVIAGDLLVHRGSANGEEIKVIEMAVVAMAEVAPVVIFPGNHDASNSYKESDMISGIFSIPHHNIHVASNYQVFDLNVKGESVRIHCLPHPSKYLYMAKNQNVPPSEVNEKLSGALRSLLHGIQMNMGEHPNSINILAGHGTIAGGLAESEMMLTTGNDLAIDRAWLPKCDAIMYGHLHKDQAVGDAVYSGCIAPLVYLKDAIIPSYRMWTFDGGESSSEKVFIPVAHQMLKVDVDEKAFIDNDNDVNDIITKSLPTLLMGFNVKMDISIPQDKYSMLSRERISEYLEAQNVNEYDLTIRQITAVKTRSDDLESGDINDESLIRVYCKLDSVRNEYVDELVKLNTMIDTMIPKSDAHLLKGASYQTRRLVFRNFKPLIDVDLVFNDLGRIVCILGANHAGKSQIAEGERFANWKQLRNGTTLADVVRKGTKSAIASHYFASGGVEYCITRTVKLSGSGKASADVLFTEFVNDTWEPINAGTSGETQIEINKVVGTYKMYEATRFGSQSDIDLLCNMLPSEMTDTLQEAMAIGGKEVKRKIAEGLRDQIESDNEDGFKEIERLDGVMANRENTTVVLKANEDNLDAIISDYANFETDLGEIKVKIALAEEVEKKRPGVQVSLDATNQELTTQTMEVNRLTQITHNGQAINDGIARQMQKRKALDDGLALNDELSKLRSEYDDSVRDLNETKNTETLKLQQVNSDIENLDGRRMSQYTLATKDKALEKDQHTESLRQTNLTITTVENQRVDAINAHDQKVKSMRDLIDEKMKVGKLVDEVSCVGLGLIDTPNGKIDLNNECVAVSVARLSKDSANDLIRETDELESKGCDTTWHHSQTVSHRNIAIDLESKIDECDTFMNAEHAKIYVESDLIDLDTKKSEHQFKITECDNAIQEKYNTHALKVDGRFRSDIARLTTNLQLEADNMWQKQADDLKVSDIALQHAQEKVNNTNGTILSLRASIAEIDAKASGLAMDRQKVTSLMATVENGKSEQSKMRKHIAGLESDLSRMDDAQIEKDRIEVSMGDAIRRITVLNTYMSAFSRSGIPYLLLERALPMFESYANDFLCSDEGFNNAPRVTMSALKKNQDGSDKEEVVIRFIDDRGEHPLGEASGYQKIAIGYALRAAMAKVYMEATGATISHCIYDEGWGAFHQDNLQYARRMIQKLGEWAGKFIYITHVPELQEIADTRIIVAPVEGGATVEVV